MLTMLLKSSIRHLPMLHTHCCHVIIGIKPCHQKCKAILFESVAQAHLCIIMLHGDNNTPKIGAQSHKVWHDISLQWCHNEHDSVSNHQPHDCLLNRLFRRRSKKTSKLRVTGLCMGNSPGTGEFPAQMASNAENVSIWWRHHVEQFNPTSPQRHPL